jgi:DNA-binding transcriptional MerR regulator
MAAEERLYSLTEMAESLGLAEPTARRYRDAFEEFLPSVGVGRRRKFTEPAKQMLARIATLVHEQRMPVEVVRRILSSERTQAELNLGSAPPPAPEDVVQELQAIRGALQALASTVEERQWPELLGNGETRTFSLGEPVPMEQDGWREQQFGAALLSMRELLTESVGVILRQLERLQQSQEEVRVRLQQVNEDLFRRDEQAQLLMEATADIAARCEAIAAKVESPNGSGRRLWRAPR